MQRRSKIAFHSVALDTRNRETLCAVTEGRSADTCIIATPRVPALYPVYACLASYSGISVFSQCFCDSMLCDDGDTKEPSCKNARNAFYTALPSAICHRHLDSSFGPRTPTHDHDLLCARLNFTSPALILLSMITASTTTERKQFRARAKTTSSCPRNI